MNNCSGTSLIGEGTTVTVRLPVFGTSHEEETKPVANADLVRVIETHLRRSGHQWNREFKPDFSSAKPLLALGLTLRALEMLNSPPGTS